MFFVLSKVLGFLVVPSNVIVGIGIVGMLLLLTRFRRAGVRMMVASLLLLLIVGITPIGIALVSALENRFPPGNEGGPPITGIIVLGGPIDTRMSTARGKLSISGEVERLLEGASLAKRHPSARLVFTAAPGPALNAAVIDLGNRFRLVANAVDVVDPDAPLPKLPVARALWVPRPDLKTAAAAWIHAGSSHHTALSLAVGAEHLRDFAEMAGVEFVLIDEHTRVPEMQKELRWNEAYGEDEAEPFQLGGSFSDELFTLPVLNEREFALRGYTSGEPSLTGHRARVATIEWRTPIADVDRHYTVPPVGLNRLSLNLFLDVGAAWERDTSPDSHRGVGAELMSELRFGYLFVLPVLLPKLSFTKKWFGRFYDQMGPARYYVGISLLLIMVMMPIKMYLRWAFNLKYFVHIQEFFFNI